MVEDLTQLLVAVIGGVIIIGVAIVLLVVIVLGLVWLIGELGPGAWLAVPALLGGAAALAGWVVARGGGGVS